MKRQLAICGATLLALTVAACSSSSPSSTGSSASSDPYVVGVNVELSGSKAPYGEGVLEGIDSAVDAANKAGGIDGRQIKVMAMDDQADPSLAVTQVKTMVNADKVIAVMGVVANYAVVVPLANSLKVPVIANGFFLDDLNPAKFPWVFPSNIAPASEMDIEAAFIASKLTAGEKPRIAVVYENSAVGVTINARALADIKARGWSLVDDSQVPDTPPFDVGPQVASIIQSKPDYIMAMDVGTTEQGLIQGLNQGNLNVPIVMYDGGSSSAVLSALADPNLYGISAFAYPNDSAEAGIRTFLANTHAAGVSPTAQYVQNGYSEGLLLIQALRLCGGSCTTSTLRTSLEKITAFSGDGYYATSVSFSAASHTGFTGAEVVHYVNGSIVPVATEHINS